MAIFILAPIIAPLIGQGLIYLGGWRATFAGLILVAVPSALWFARAIPETVPQDRRRFTPGIIADSILEVCRTRVTMVYLLVMGFVSGPFIAYLATSRQIFQDIYDAGDMFVIYFAMGSISAGAASLLNARLVMRHGMRRLSFIAMTTLTLISALRWGWTEFVGHPGFILFMVWQTSFMFCNGMISEMCNRWRWGRLAMSPGWRRRSSALSRHWSRCRYPGLSAAISTTASHRLSPASPSPG